MFEISVEDIRRAKRKISSAKFRDAHRQKRRDEHRQYKKDNRERIRRQKREWYQRWKLKNLRSAILKRYGVDLDWWDSKLIQQSGGCGICGVKINGSRNLSIDHNHVSGKTRGILCNRCNHVIGFIESPLFLKARLYLERYDETGPSSVGSG